LKIQSDTTNIIFFPIGKSGIYAPISILKEKAVPITYSVEYFNKKTNTYDSERNYPLDDIDSTQYWKIEKIKTNLSQEVKC
jgi:hypothetical protein